MPRNVTVSIVQMLAVDGEKDRAVDRMAAHLEEAGRRGSAIAVLPELWTGTGFSEPALHREIAEEIPGPVTERLSGIARRYGMAICGSL
jgi:predicted amidohydrolase